MCVNAGDPHHEDGGEDEDDVEEGQAQQQDVDGTDHGRPDILYNNTLYVIWNIQNVLYDIQYTVSISRLYDTCYTELIIYTIHDTWNTIYNT